MPFFITPYYNSLFFIWLATREKGHSDSCVNCRLESDRTGLTEKALYNYIRFCAKVDLLKTEKNTQNGKCRFRLACADCAG